MKNGKIKKIHEEQEKQKKEERNKRSREERWHVRNEQKEITQLRKRIKNNEKLLSYIRSMTLATNFTNEMFGYNERIEIIKDNPLELKNQKLQERINELEEIKKNKLKELRENRKNKK